jgi:hypothetical protein
MGILPMRPTGILPVGNPLVCRAKMALQLTGKMPVLRCTSVLIHGLCGSAYGGPIQSLFHTHPVDGG